ncbi:MAG: hypothetical protein EOS27_12140 [Mesorhizobium sp.]|nr:MAG: hypothetical protein EOS27_12140 [Mesorhizobium sp.]
MIRHPILSLLALSAWLMFPAVAWSADPLVRARVQTQGQIVVGQQVTITVDVLVPNFFMSSPRFPRPDIPNAVVLLQDGAQNLVETIDGTTYAGIRRSYLVTPQTPGDFTLPQAQIMFSYAAVPGQPPVDGAVALPTETFVVAGVPGASGAGTTVAAKVTVTQTLDRDPKKLAAGDALVRTVTVRASGMQAMMIPEPDIGTPDGVRLYRHDPRLSDEKGPQGQITGGTRTDTLTYAFDKAGDYTLPAIEIRWFDPASGTTELATAPAVVAHVGEAAAFVPAIAPPRQAAESEPDRQFPWLRDAAWAVAATILAAAAFWIIPRLWRRFAVWRAMRRERRARSEAAYFSRFEQACRSGDGLAVYASLDSWSRRAGTMPLAVWLQRTGERSAEQEYARFEEAVFGAHLSDRTWNLQRLAQAMSRARIAWQRQAPSDAMTSPKLPELNP